MTTDTILIAAFAAALAWAYWNQLKHDAQVKLNNDLISIINKQKGLLEEQQDAITQYQLNDKIINP